MRAGKNNPSSFVIRHASFARAFTLFEMTLVVLVIGIVAAALIPPIGANLTSPRLGSAANTLATDIEFCASECIAQPNVPRAIYFDTANNKYTVQIFSTSVPLKHPGDGMDFINDFASGRNAQLAGVTISRIVSGGTSPTTLTFDAYGKPLLTADLVITLSYNSQNMNITVNATTGDVTITGG